MTQFGNIGSVEGNRLILEHGRQEPVVISLDHVNSVSTARSRHQVIGVVFVLYGVLALLGVVTVAVSDGVFKQTQAVPGVGGLLIGLFLFMGRQVIRIETSSGTTRTVSVFWWDADRAIALVNAVCDRLFRAAA